MKKVLSVLTIGLTLTINVFASNMLKQLANILTDNIYCPTTITMENNTFYGAPSVFNRGYGSVGFPEKTPITFYFKLAAEESGSAVCIYNSEDQQMSETIIAGKPLKANTDALHNNWTSDTNDTNSLTCLYNAAHCPLMNY